MGIPSTDPNRFAIHRRYREIANTGLDDELAREFATEEILEAPSRERQMADVYREIREQDRATWQTVRKTLVDAGFSLQLHHKGRELYTPVPSVEELLSLYQQHIVPLLITEPESELFETLVYVLEQGASLRAKEGVMQGREEAQIMFLQKNVHEMYDTYEHARVGSPRPNL